MAQDIDIIRAVLGGDVESFGFLVERYEKPVIRMIKNMTGDRESCEDIAQDVFFAAYRKLRSYDCARSEFSTWLFTIARNKSINALRKKRVATTGDLPDGSDSHNPSDELCQKELFERLNRKLQLLPAKQRRAFVMAEFEKLAYEQIAQIEAVKIGTVKSRINRAKTGRDSAGLRTESALDARLELSLGGSKSLTMRWFGGIVLSK